MEKILVQLAFVGVGAWFIFRKAYVDPRNPGRAVLESPSQQGRALAYTLVGAGLCVVAYFA